MSRYDLHGLYPNISIGITNLCHYMASHHLVPLLAAKSLQLGIGLLPQVLAQVLFELGKCLFILSLILTWIILWGIFCPMSSKSIGKTWDYNLLWTLAMNCSLTSTPSLSDILSRINRLYVNLQSPCQLGVKTFVVTAGPTSILDPK